MEKNVTVPVGYVKSLLDSVQAQGYDVDALLDYVGIAREEIEFQTEFPASKLGKLYQRIMWVMQDESFGMVSGGKVPNGTFRMMCLTIIHCSTLEQAINRCSDFFEICRGTQIKPSYERCGKQAAIRIVSLDRVSRQRFEEILAQESPSAIRTSLSLWHHFMCWLVGTRIQVQNVSFTFPKPPDAEDYETLFQAPIRFDQPVNEFRIAADALKLPIVQTEETLEGFLKTAPFQLLVAVDGDNSLASQVRAIIGKDFSREIPSAEEVAESLNMSVTTLRRRLLKENTSFQKIKDECRKEAAINYLNCPGLSNNDVAALLGFDETSAFFRSFKKWTGLTPGEYRQRRRWDAA